MKLNLKFYFQPIFFYGGYVYSQIEAIISNLSRSKKGLEIVDYFIDLFTQLLDLNDDIYFSGCMKNMRINTFQLDFNDLAYVIDYANVRFDGCPSIKNFELISDNQINQVSPRIEKLYEGVSDDFTAFDSHFQSFTEYFYRVIAVNTLGEAASNWIVVRTPDAIPTYEVNTYFLNAQAISGYQISVRNITRYCYYCDSYNFLDEIFTGVANRFILTIMEVTQSPKMSVFVRNVTYQCNTVCLNNVRYTNKNSQYLEVFEQAEDYRSTELLVRTKPVTNYELRVSVCTISGCVASGPVLVRTLEEVPSELEPPELIESTSTTLNLVWSPPKFPNGK